MGKTTALVISAINNAMKNRNGMLVCATFEAARQAYKMVEHILRLIERKISFKICTKDSSFQHAQIYIGTAGELVSHMGESRLILFT